MKINISKFSIFVCLLIIVLVGCNSKEQDINTIKVSEITEEQKEILKLIDYKGEINLLDYNVDDSYKSIYIELEEYKDGELVAKRINMTLSLKNPKGKLMTTVEKDNENIFKISLYKDMDNCKTATFKLNKEFEPKDKGMSSNVMLSNLVEVKPDEEILLRGYFFTTGDELSTYSPQEYVKDPDIINQYEYAYLLKCKLSKNTSD